VTVIPEGALTVSADGKQAKLEMKDVPVIDQPKWPAHDAATMAAKLSFRIEWTATGEPVTYNDPAKLFRFTGWLATTRLEAQVTVPALRFSWKSDPLETSTSSFGIIGTEVNGKYYTP
jgi:hypothetical protein